MIVASPIRSATAASATAKTTEYTMSVPRARSRPTQPTSVGASQTPTRTAATRKTTAFAASRPTAPRDTLPVCATPVTTARMIRPRMSSTTAAPSTTLAAAS